MKPLTLTQELARRGYRTGPSKQPYSKTIIRDDVVAFEGPAWSAWTWLRGLDAGWSEEDARAAIDSSHPDDAEALFGGELR